MESKQQFNHPGASVKDDDIYNGDVPVREDRELQMAEEVRLGLERWMPHLTFISQAEVGSRGPGVVMIDRDTGQTLVLAVREIRSPEAE